LNNWRNNTFSSRKLHFLFLITNKSNDIHQPIITLLLLTTQWHKNIIVWLACSSWQQRSKLFISRLIFPSGTRNVSKIRWTSRNMTPISFPGDDMYTTESWNNSIRYERWIQCPNSDSINVNNCCETSLKLLQSNVNFTSINLFLHTH